MKRNYLLGAFMCMLGCYSCSNVTVNDSLLIDNSIMVFGEANGINLAQGFKVKKTSFDSKDETWTQPWGENKTNRNHYNEMVVDLTNKDNVQLTLRFRVFDDGVGFRYEYNVPSADSLLISDENTTFRFR